MNNQNNFCMYCGAQLLTPTNFCPNCGQPLIDITKTQNTSSTSTNNNQSQYTVQNKQEISSSDELLAMLKHAQPSVQPAPPPEPEPAPEEEEPFYPQADAVAALLNAPVENNYSENVSTQNENNSPVDETSVQQTSEPSEQQFIPAPESPEPPSPPKSETNNTESAPTPEKKSVADMLGTPIKKTTPPPLPKSKVESMFASGLNADEEADFEKNKRRGKIQSDLEDESSESSSGESSRRRRQNNVSGRKAGTSKNKKNYKSMYVNKPYRIYDIEQELAVFDPDDPDYDGFYENVKPVDWDELNKRHSSSLNIDPKQLLILGVLVVVILGCVLATVAIIKHGPI